MPELPASPRVSERLLVRGRDLRGHPCVGRVTAFSIYIPMARYHTRLEVVDCDHVGTAIADSRRHLDKIGSKRR